MLCVIVQYGRHKITFSSRTFSIEFRTTLGEVNDKNVNVHCSMRDTKDPFRIPKALDFQKYYPCKYNFLLRSSMSNNIKICDVVKLLHKLHDKLEEVFLFLEDFLYYT